jgi:hypothetical protein
MTPAQRISHQLAPALLLLAAVLAAWNWLLRPDRPVVWAVVLVLLAVMAVAFRAGRRAVVEAVAFAGAFLTLCLAGTLAKTLGGFADANLAWRATMVLVGVFFVVTGNAFPKTLTPLADLHCDPVRIQSFQRFAGWTWVLTGLAFANVWLVLPVGVAQPVSTVLLLTGMLLVATQLVRLRRTRGGAL